MAVKASDLESEVTFISGVDDRLTLGPTTYFTWNSQASGTLTYGSQSVARKWGGGAAGTAGETVEYAFDAASHWSDAEKASFKGAMALWSSVANISFSQAADDQASSAKLVFQRGSGNDGTETLITNASSRLVARN